MTINKLRGMLYKTAKILGDVQAVTSPKPHAITKRIGRRIVGKATGRLLGKLFPMIPVVCMIVAGHVFAGIPGLVAVELPPLVVLEAMDPTTPVDMQFEGQTLGEFLAGCEVEQIEQLEENYAGN